MKLVIDMEARLSPSLKTLLPTGRDRPHPPPRRTARYVICHVHVQAIDFFGQERVLFGTDTPMDMGQSGMFTQTTIASLESLDATPADKEALYSG